MRLENLARAAVRSMPMPKTTGGLYPQIHSTAYALDWPDKAEALGAVFRVICDAIGTKYKGEYMDRVLSARLKDGTLEIALRAL